MLFADGRPIGVVEAKRLGATLSGVEPQAWRYAIGLPPASGTAGPDRHPHARSPSTEPPPRDVNMSIVGRTCRCVAGHCPNHAGIQHLHRTRNHAAREYTIVAMRRPLRRGMHTGHGVSTRGNGTHPDAIPRTGRRIPPTARHIGHLSRSQRDGRTTIRHGMHRPYNIGLTQIAPTAIRHSTRGDNGR